MLYTSYIDDVAALYFGDSLDAGIFGVKPNANTSILGILKRPSKWCSIGEMGSWGMVDLC
jgi:hypothetical protein